jgi:hypothetical protein
MFLRALGRFLIFDETDAIILQTEAYAGKGDDKNNIHSDRKQGLGPLPSGLYFIAGPVEHRRFGPMAFHLAPSARNRMYGRSGFMIHGDSRKNPGQGSAGCIVLDRRSRTKLADLKVVSLTVG